MDDNKDGFPLTLIGSRQFLFKRIASISGVDSLVMHVCAQCSPGPLLHHDSRDKCDKLFFLKQFCEGDDM